MTTDKEGKKRNKGPRTGKRMTLRTGKTWAALDPHSSAHPLVIFLTTSMNGLATKGTTVVRDVVINKNGTSPLGEEFGMEVEYLNSHYSTISDPELRKIVVPAFVKGGMSAALQEVKRLANLPYPRETEEEKKKRLSEEASPPATVYVAAKEPTPSYVSIIESLEHGMEWLRHSIDQMKAYQATESSTAISVETISPPPVSAEDNPPRGPSNNAAMASIDGATEPTSGKKSSYMSKELMTN